jgi:hypothetical protein
MGSTFMVTPVSWAVHERAEWVMLTAVECRIVASASSVNVYCLDHPRSPSSTTGSSQCPWTHYLLEIVSGY